MGKVAELAATLAIMAALAGKLPWAIRQARLGQLRLIQESKSSNWGKAWIPSHK